MSTYKQFLFLVVLSDIHDIMINYDYLIIGQGIAGTMLTHFLLKKGRRILVVDNYNPSSSSNIAAGLFNPITGKRFVKTWKAESILPFAEQTYGELEILFNEEFYFPKNILRVLTGQDDMNLIMSKSENPEYKGYFNRDFETDHPGFIEITGAGYVDMAKLIKLYRSRLLSEHVLIECSVGKEDLYFEGDRILWNNSSFGKIIFCEGYKASSTPFFSWLPFVLAKGEILIIRCRDFKQNKIWMKDMFILPLGDDYYKVGSTYQWDNRDEIPTEEGRRELTQKLDNLLECSYEIVEHYAGIRPAIKDRKPVIGMHPDHINIGIFNGLGAKGASLAPFFANHFVEYLEDGKPLDIEVDIKRFLK